MQGFLYTVDPNQGKSRLATFIVRIYGTTINNLRLSLFEARCTEGNPHTCIHMCVYIHGVSQEGTLCARDVVFHNEWFCGPSVVTVGKSGSGILGVWKTEVP